MYHVKLYEERTKSKLSKREYSLRKIYASQIQESILFGFVESQHDSRCRLAKTVEGSHSGRRSLTQIFSRMGPAAPIAEQKAQLQVHNPTRV
jgi:hypothetical protein